MNHGKLTINLWLDDMADSENPIALELFGTERNLKGLQAYMKSTRSTQPVQPTIPEGYVLVPIDPTQAMLNAAHKKGFFRQLAIPMWDAMIAARQQQKE